MPGARPVGQFPATVFEWQHPKFLLYLDDQLADMEDHVHPLWNFQHDHAAPTITPIAAEEYSLPGKDCDNSSRNIR